MNPQIVALVLGILALLVSLLELLGEINKKRMLGTVKKANNLFVPLPDSPSHLLGNASDKDDIIRLFESCFTEQRATLLQYLQNKQLAEMDRNRLSGIWWFFLSLFQQAYSLAEHRRPTAAEKKLAD